MPIFHLNRHAVFPPPELAEEGGLLAVGGDLSPERLIAAYRRGIFPWYGEGDPILWWFTSPRLVLLPIELRVPRRLARYVRNIGLYVTVDMAFSEVISMCADIRTDARRETWISTEMQQAYIRLHRLGYAHSIECWSDHTLAGGLYGVALDRVFFGESMFSTINNASKIALIYLVAHLRKKSFQLIDCQMTTLHLLRLGAREITGERFSELLRRYIQSTTPDGNWTDDTKNNS